MLDRKNYESAIPQLEKKIDEIESGQKESGINYDAFREKTVKELKVVRSGIVDNNALIIEERERAIGAEETKADADSVYDKSTTDSMVDEASTMATDFIEPSTVGHVADDCIKVFPKAEKDNPQNYVQIDSDSVDIIRDGETVASFGDATFITKDNSSLILTGNSMALNDANGNEVFSTSTDISSSVPINIQLIRSNGEGMRENSTYTLSTPYELGSVSSVSAPGYGACTNVSFNASTRKLTFKTPKMDNLARVFYVNVAGYTRIVPPTTVCERVVAKESLMVKGTEFSELYKIKQYTISSRSWASGGNWLTNEGLSPSADSGYEIIAVVSAVPSDKSALIPVLRYNSSAREIRGFVRNLGTNDATDSITVDLLERKV